MGKRPAKPKRTLKDARVARGERPLGGKGYQPPGASGRPPTRFTYDPQTAHGQRESARGRLAAELDDCVTFVIAVRRGRIRGAPDALGVRMRAAENILDRAGLPRKAEVDLDGPLTAKLYRIGTYRTKDGTRHELPEDPSGDPRLPGA